MIWFAIASLLPAVLLAAGALWGGVWAAAGVLSITVLVFFLDKIANKTMPDTHEASGAGLSIGLGVAHLLLLPLVVWAVSSNPALSMLDKVLLVTGAGLWFGQVSNSNAHELIHRPLRSTRRLGRALYASILYGHHASAHLRVHHVHAATDRDPNSARVGEGFWAFALRCAVGEYTEGLAAESAARAQLEPKPSLWSHPFLSDALVSSTALALAFALGGWSGVGVLAILSAYAAWQLMLSDYVQHYGLRRRVLANGKPEPVGPHHSWNAPRWYSSAMMLNAPRHSDHHMNPARPFPALALDRDTMPTLPQSLPVMAVIALVPPIWRRLMDHRAQRWRLKAEGPDGRRARDIPQAVLDHARGTGPGRRPLPNWPHDPMDDIPARPGDRAPVQH
ncbi:alkane 1-monooxygenase [Primorskyibacter sp. S187A]|uniref:alkane 1-monooxygenase n=1 Tax=Primorskyibacter sp. S187A TaxID=3415130 RepID=UPI003C7E6937